MTFETREDPFHLVPIRFPAAPRVYVTSAQLARTRAIVREAPWGGPALARLIRHAKAAPPPPDRLPVPAVPRQNNAVLEDALRAAVLGALTGESAWRTRARHGVMAIARTWPDWVMTPPNRKAVGGSTGEHHFIVNLARTIDLLNAELLPDEETEAFTALLRATLPVTDAEAHRDCNNHNTSALMARLHVGAALGDSALIQEALYGWGIGAERRVGFVHQLRHDFLGDGTWFERANGYHAYLLYALANMADCLAHLGVDLWQAQFPGLEQPDPLDLHRQYAPATPRPVQGAFDALLYKAFPDGSLPMLHDSPVPSLAGLHRGWGNIYELAYEAYGDPVYAAVIGAMDRAPARTPEEAAMPACLRGEFIDSFECDLIRMRRTNLPDAVWDWRAPRTIGATGRNEAGATLFPDAECAVLRPGEACAVALNWARHAAGHQSPASLHLDLWLGGQIVTATPHAAGYGDSTYLTWARTTLAHNTVTIDRTPMIPYHAGGDSIWEAESYHDAHTQGELLLWQLEKDFQAIRVASRGVYPGVDLIRTVVATPHYVIDRFDVEAGSSPRLMDWAMHLQGALESEPHTEPLVPESALGYRHLIQPRRVVSAEGMTALTWRLNNSLYRGLLLLPTGAEMRLADDPSPSQRGPFHALTDTMAPQFSVLLRMRAIQAHFLSVWSAGVDVRIEGGIDERERGCGLTVEAAGSRVQWEIPGRGTNPVRRNSDR